MCVHVLMVDLCALEALGGNCANKRDSRVGRLTAAAEQKQRQSFNIFIYFSGDCFRIVETHMKQ